MGKAPEKCRTILLVEDNPDDALFARRAFSRVCPEAHLTLARDGEAAVNYLSGRGEFEDRTLHPLPALILMDLKLPRKSGLEVLEWMRHTPALDDIPVIIFSSSNHPRDVERANELGVMAYHVKPISHQDYLETAKSICRIWNGLPERFTTP